VDPSVGEREEPVFSGQAMADDELDEAELEEADELVGLEVVG
jgi:hypothetical protein